MTVKVRFAPSPTGIPHIGNIRTALFDYFFSKKNKGVFILRIEDTDQARIVEGAIEAIKDSLTWLGAFWDEYLVQSTKLEEYKKYASELIEKNLAKNDNGAIRFIVPRIGSTFWIDKVGNKKIEFENKEVEDFIILKSDGYPTYHLANVVDDHAQAITHVIRGEDWISSTPKHIMLYKALGWGDSIPEFVHVPNIKEANGMKLSKRKGAKSVLEFRSDGYLPEALLNYLMLLGWSPKDDREILSKEEIASVFDLENINTAPSIFDPKKLLWINGEYIRKIGEDELQKRLLEFDPGISSIPNFQKYIPFAKTRMRTLADFRVLVENEKNFIPTENQKKLAESLKETYLHTEPWKATPIATATISVRDALGAGTKDIFTVLTGRPQGLPFEQKLEVQGKEDTISWLEEIINK